MKKSGRHIIRISQGSKDRVLGGRKMGDNLFYYSNNGEFFLLENNAEKSFRSMEDLVKYVEKTYK